ncbi:MAG: RC-LH1 core complex protein PufX [Rhodobacteraceae bacterium]|nr:RC-LH1 core complex protein PufX [Paracoccaceae bacterium]
MSDNFYTETNRTATIRSWIMWQMLRGMGWAAAFVFAVGVIFGAIWAVGQILPDESKTAPSPYGALEITSPQSVTA